MIAETGGRDLVVGCITGYGLDVLWPWMVSLDACGFFGDRAMIVYDADFRLVNTLLERGFLVVTFDRDEDAGRYRFEDSAGEQILVSRFFHLWCLLRELATSRYRYVIHADVKDVVFQGNPSDWLERHLGDKLLNVGSESVRFVDEPWGKGVLSEAFEGPIHDDMLMRTIYNAGTMAGTAAAMRDFSLQVYLTAAGRPECPDQASANILFSLEPFRTITRFSSSEDGWACQAGTTVAPSYITEQMVPLLEPSPVFDGRRVLTTRGEPFCLVHQYDRVPEWRDVLRRMYSQDAETPAPRQHGRLLRRPEWRLKTFR